MASSTPPPVLKLSSRVSVAAGNGIIKFVGPTAFAPGKWVGIELDELNGKNDGSVAGKRYFTCEQGKGMFVKPTMIRLLNKQDSKEGEEDREVSPTPSRPSISRASISRSSTSTSNRPLSTSTSRPSSSTSATRPSSRPSLSSTIRPSTALSVSGRSSVTSSGTASPSLVRSSSKLGGSMAPTGRLSRASTAPSPRMSSTPTLPPPTTSVSRRASIVPPSTSASSSTTKSKSLVGGPMLPPPAPSTLRSLPRPISPAKKPLSNSIITPLQSPIIPLSTTSSTNTNFAPPSPAIGTPRSLVRPRNLSIVSNSSSGISSITGAGSGISLGLGISRIASPSGGSGIGFGGGGGGGFGLRRPTSGLSNRSYDEGSLLDEMSPRMGKGIDGLGDGLVLGYDSEVEEVQDRFSLKGVESKKVAEATVSKREHEELLAKLRILEARRADDRERLREVDRLKEESEEWLKVKEKSKAKLVELSTELKDLKKQTKELTAERDVFELKFDDLTDQVEISLLDKEMAEEKFEASEHALETAQERVAELEVELEVLRGENARMEGVGDEAIAKGEGLTSSLAYIQLEKQNERLKDTLLRFRDHTSESDAEHRRRIADLEKELDLTSDLQGVFDNTVVEFERAEAQIEELKLQLDDALGAEDMLEELTDKNMTLNEKLDELHAIVEDLEALQELNDELEESHLETEKQMQDEIDLKESQLREQQRKVETLDESIVDYESTIGQFRELVLSLQSDLEQLKEYQASQQTVSQSLNSQSQAMLNLNLKLQSTVAKGQVKTIDLELKKLAALQAADQMAIMKPYLLPAYFEDDSDAVDALLFFERIGYKADLISMIIEQTHNVTDSLNSVVPEDLIGICETRCILSKFSSLNKRFAAQLKRCSPDLFVKMGRIYHEVSTTEKRIDLFIDSLRREEFREVECTRELEGLIAQGGHLAETHLQESLLDLAERELAHIVALELDFDTIAASVGFTKQALATIVQDPDIIIEGGEEDIDEVLFKPLQDLVNQARNSKVVAKKLLRRMHELITASSALSIEHLQGFETLSHNSSAIAIATSKLTTSITQYCASLRSTKDPFQLPAILSLVKEITESEFGKSSGRPLGDIGTLLGQLGVNLGVTLASSLESEGVVLLAFTPPWIARVKELQSNSAINLDSERKLVKVNEDMKELVREMRSKDQLHQESSVKIELMEKRMESVKKQAEAILEIESELSKSKKQERAYEEAIEALQGDLDMMEQELNKLKVVISTSDKQGASNKSVGEGETISYEGNMETSRLIEQIESLRGAVRFLRSENSYLKSQDLLLELEELPSYSSPRRFSSSSPTGLPLSSSSIKSVLSRDPSIVERNFQTESKLLLREARMLSATPKMIDLSLVRRGGKATGWTAKSRDPSSQWEVEKERFRDLSRRIEKLKEMRGVTVSGRVW